MHRSAQRVTPTSIAPRPVAAGSRSHSEVADPLATYFRDVAQHPVMSREEELEVATAIVTLRQAHWRALLGHPPLATAVCDVVRELMPEPPTALLTAVEQTAAALLRRAPVAPQRAHAAACEALVLTLAEHDVDGDIAERIVADCERASEQPASKVKRERSDGLAFTRHLAEVRATLRALAAAKQRFIRANLRLVVMVARRFNHGQLALHDLIQEGNIGLMKAVDRFDPRRGFRFSTYAGWWIRHAISRAMADKGRAVRLPVHMIDAQNKVARVRREFAVQHGREPADAELADAAGLSLERIHRMRWSLVEGPVSFDAPIGRAPGHTLLDVLADAEAPAAAELLDSDLLHRRLRVAFAALPAMEAAVLRERMGMDDAPERTLREIGERHALSRERIRQIQERALARLRREFRRHDLM